MIVNVQARRNGMPYTFSGVMVNSIDELRNNYAAAGITIEGYDVINAATPVPISSPTPASITASMNTPINIPGSPNPVQNTTSANAVITGLGSFLQPKFLIAAALVYFFLLKGGK